MYCWLFLFIPFCYNTISMYSILVYVGTHTYVYLLLMLVEERSIIFLWMFPFPYFLASWKVFIVSTATATFIPPLFSSLYPPTTHMHFHHHHTILLFLILILLCVVCWLCNSVLTWLLLFIILYSTFLSSLFLLLKENSLSIRIFLLLFFLDVLPYCTQLGFTATKPSFVSLLHAHAPILTLAG